MNMYKNENVKNIKLLFSEGEVSSPFFWEAMIDIVIASRIDTDDSLETDEYEYSIPAKVLDRMIHICLDYMESYYDVEQVRILLDVPELHQALSMSLGYDELFDGEVPKIDNDFVAKYWPVLWDCNCDIVEEICSQEQLDELNQFFPYNRPLTHRKRV